MNFIRTISCGAFKGGPEPLDKDTNEILGSKREDRLSDPFFELVQNTTLVRFSHLLRLCNLCKEPDLPHHLWMPKLPCGHHGKDLGSLTYTQSYTKITGE